AAKRLDGAQRDAPRAGRQHPLIERLVEPARTLNGDGGRRPPWVVLDGGVGGAARGLRRRDLTTHPGTRSPTRGSRLSRAGSSSVGNRWHRRLDRGRAHRRNGGMVTGGGRRSSPLAQG